MKVFNSIIGSGGSLPSFITPQTVNIGTGGTLALESGNLASINAKLPQLGQALSASSVPVVLPVSQVTALTPPTTIGIGNTPTVNIGTGGTLALESGNLASINTKLPTSLGSKSATTSLSVVQSYASTSTNSSVSSGTSSVVLVASNVARRTLTITNNSTAILYVNMNASVASTSNYSIALPPLSGGVSSSIIIKGDDYSGEIRGIWASANGSALITEVT